MINDFKISINMRISQVNFHRQITSRLLSFKGKLPSEFARHHKSLIECDRWKATEFKSFLLHTGPVALKCTLRSSYYKHFLSLSQSVRILCDDNEMKRNVLLEFAKELLNCSVHNSKECYGDTFCVYHVLGLIHIADDVEYFKNSLQAISALELENYLQELKIFFQSRHNPVDQIMKCLWQLQGLSREQKSLELNTGHNIRGSCFLVDNGVVIIQSKLRNGDIVCDFYHEILLEDFFDTFIPSKQFDIFYVKGHIQPQHIIKRQADLIKKFTYFPHKSGHVAFPMLNNINYHNILVY